MQVATHDPESQTADIDARLMRKLADRFEREEQLAFVQNFHMYLNHDVNRDFVVDLDDVWTWMGFSAKRTAKDLLLRCFSKDVDYKISLDFSLERFAQTDERLAHDTSVPQNGGQNRQTILMTVNCFKKLCMRANTAKASQIHDYYVKMEECLHEYIVEGCQPLTSDPEKSIYGAFVLENQKCKAMV